VDLTRVRLAVFDVYGTLLRVRVRTEEDAAARFAALGREVFGAALPMGWADLADWARWAGWQEQVRTTVARHHAVARQAGVRFPEVNWPVVVSEALRYFERTVTPQQAARWAALVMSCGREVEQMPGAVEVVQECQRRGWRLGVASNAQAYTLDEVGAVFSGSGVGLPDFTPELTLWSFDLGFSKPSPEIFQILSQRAGRYGVRREEILMIGDRMDNDLVPARLAGWQAWAVCPQRGLSPLWEMLKLLP
jgi:FMN phosphatase YigB (HAD superfamily)